MPVRNTHDFGTNPHAASQPYRDVGTHAEVSTWGSTDHLNPVIVKLAAGLTDMAAIVAKKNVQPERHALRALSTRSRPVELGCETGAQCTLSAEHWADIELMGVVIFNGVDTKDQALAAVRTMRYPPLRGTPRREPVGIRGYSTAAASYAWGVSTAEYERRADVWPHNPDGDLLAVTTFLARWAWRPTLRKSRRRFSRC